MSEWLTVGEARELLQVSKGKFADLVKTGVLTIGKNELDKRIKLVSRADVDRLVSKPRGKSKKEAA